MRKFIHKYFGRSSDFWRGKKLRATSKWRLFLLLVSLGSGAPLLALDECVYFPQDHNPESDGDASVEVCVTDDSYRFRIVDQVKIFSKQEFESRLNLALSQWFTSHNLGEYFSSSKRVYVWMTVPEANPQAAQPRVLIETPKGYLSFWINLDADDWRLSDDETAILGQGKYPETFGYRPQKLIIKAQPQASSAEVAAALMDAGALEIETNGGGWYTAKANVFEERSVADLAMKSSSSTLKFVQVNSVVEWIAQRQLVFSYLAEF